jgi:superfamily II DNA/RNA helicase
VRILAGEDRPEIVTPLKLERSGRRMRASAGERAPAPAGRPAPAAAPKARRTRKAAAAAVATPETGVQAPTAEPTVEATAEPARPETAPKARRTRKTAAVAAPEAVAAEPEAAPKPRRTRKAVAAAPEGATAAAASKRRRSPKTASAGPVEAPVEAETAAPPDVAPELDLGPDFVPTITRVRTVRRRGRVEKIETPVEPGSAARRRPRRPLRRARPTTELRPELRPVVPEGPTPLDPAPAAAPERVVAFGGLSLTAQTARALDEMAYHEPTEIQALAIPLLLEGKDVVGQAQTGTGKTAAFGIPMVERIDPEMLVVQALVLAPTRELASQIALELGRIGRRRGVRVAAIYGGASMGGQLRDLARGAQVVVGTPGRILDHLKRGTLSFESVSYLVLDEADRMLDMGFMPDVERILRRTPRSRQTALFSATIPTVIRIIARRHMRDAVTVQVKPEERTVKEVEQVYYEVAERDKPEALRVVLQEQAPERAMVFCRTQIAVDRLTRILRRDGLAVEAIHGSMGQAQRERVLADFRRGAIRLLVATNLAARGLDIPEVSHVINYDIPEEGESYVHRIGRTARMGREGMAITFVAEWDEKSLSEIKKVANGSLRHERLSLYA